MSDNLAMSVTKKPDSKVSESKEITSNKDDKHASSKVTKKRNKQVVEKNNLDTESFLHAKLNQTIDELIALNGKYLFNSDNLQKNEDVFDSTTNILKMAIIDNNFDIPSSFSLEGIIFEKLEKISAFTENYSLLVRAYQYTNSAKISKRIKNLIFSSVDNFDNFLKNVSKSNVVSKKLLTAYVEELCQSSYFEKSPLNVKLRVISFLCYQDRNPTNYLKDLENITIEFNDFDDETQWQTIRALDNWSSTAVYQFLTHLDSDRIRYALSNRLLDYLTADKVYDFFVWEKIPYKMNKVGVFKRIIKPWCEKIYDRTVDLQDLILLWPYLVEPKYGFKEEELKVKLKSLINSKGVLAQSLRDKAIPVLQSELQKLKDDSRELRSSLAQSQARVEELSSINTEIQSELIEFRNQKIVQSKESLGARESNNRQVKIDLLKELVPFVEASLANSSPDQLVRILEKLGLEMVGKPGQIVRWNPQICESLTGESIQEGEVVNSGLTWFDGNSVIPIRRMLIKPT